MYKRLFEVDEWRIVTHELPKKDMRLLESLTSIGNGFMGMRGNFEENYSGDTHRGSYIAGVWFPDKTRVGWWKNGYPEYFGKVINSIDYIGVSIFINGEQVDLNIQDHRDLEIVLDMRNGILTRQYIINVGGTEIKLKVERFLSIVQPNIAAIRVTAEALSDDAKLRFEPYLNGQVVNEDSNYDEMFWDSLPETIACAFPYIKVQTKENEFGVERFQVAAMMANSINGVAVQKQTADRDADGFQVTQAIEAELVTGCPVILDKLVAVVNDRHIADLEADIVPAARDILEAAVKKGFDSLKDEHRAAWWHRWDLADVQITGDIEAQQGIRFNIFQLFSTYYGEDATLNIGPKGFTGEKYGGATYWDTEAFIMPMYLSVAEPRVTRQLLTYRWNQLAEAYYNARQLGLDGALFPMVTFNGIECHNEWEITFEEIHRNGAMAWAIWNYTNYNNDQSYLFNQGIEVLISISRFWADRVHWSEHRQQYEIHGVTGPNEYENNVNNNYHTNNMARWTLRFTLATLNNLDEMGKSTDHVSVSQQERARWLEIANQLFINYNEDTKIFMQHDGFMNKNLVPVTELDPANLPLNQKWSWDRILRSPYIKQADVLQSIYMLNHEYTDMQVKANFDFYEAFTVHESSLSASIHSVLAAQIGDFDKAYALYKRTARLDLDNYNNDTEDGLHITSMSGAWLAIVHGFAGMRVHHNQLQFKPFLPGGWNNYEFTVLYRSRQIRVSIHSRQICLKLIEGDSVEVAVNGNDYKLADTLIVAI